MSRCRMDCLKRAAVLLVGMIILIACAPLAAPCPYRLPDPGDLTALTTPVDVAET